MPIYEYRCLGCQQRGEIILPTYKRDNPQTCPNCGRGMRRLVSLPYPAIWKISTKDQVMDTLNKEEGSYLPGGDKHRKRYEAALSKGIDYVRPLEERTFQGFG